MSAQFLQQIAQIAKENGNIPILSDEVYRPVFHKGVETPPSIIDIYSHGIATGSLSKGTSSLYSPSQQPRLTNLRQHSILVSRNPGWLDSF